MKAQVPTWDGTDAFRERPPVKPVPVSGCPTARHGEKLCDWGMGGSTYVHESHGFEVPMTADKGATFAPVLIWCPGFPAAPS